jgi:hypothetical protein
MGEDTKMTDKRPRELQGREKEEEETPASSSLSPKQRQAPGSSLWAVGSLIKIRCFIPTRTCQNSPTMVGNVFGASVMPVQRDISSAAAVLLDPSGPCARGRELLHAGRLRQRPWRSRQRKWKVQDTLTAASEREVRAG